MKSPCSFFFCLLNFLSQNELQANSRNLRGTPQDQMNHFDLIKLTRCYGYRLAASDAGLALGT